MKNQVNKQFRGVFGIIPTPFRKSGEVDEQSLKRIVQFCLEAGSHGVVTPVNASEFTSLTDEERTQIIKIVSQEVDGKIPVVAGVAGGSSEHAQHLTKEAVKAGVDSLIAMPPYIRKCTSDEIVTYYQAIDECANGLPVWIQNNMPPIGTIMSPELMSKIIDSTKNVLYIKEECHPSGHLMTQMFNLKNAKLKGIHGGMASRFIMDEYDRGSCGTMPACEICDVHVQLWNKLEEGDMRGARDIFNKMLPLLNMEYMYGSVVYKEVLYRRGIIENPILRKSGNFPLDNYDHRELDQILKELKPLFKF